MMYKYSGIIFLLAFLLFLFLEVLCVYLIMPLPGSQQSDWVEIAYALNRYIWLSRVVFGALLLWTTSIIFRGQKLWSKMSVILAGLILIVLIYCTTFVARADKIFLQPETKLMKPTIESTIDTSRLILGVALHGEASAYPIYLIGYHHQVCDTVGGIAIMVTYCTMCRTGTVFQPMVQGRHEIFGLVGMDQYNALFQDASTHSWWRQATGECCAGKLKGTQLPVVSTEQMSIAAWVAKHPNTHILQPDPKFAKKYEQLSSYEKGVDKLEFSAKWRK